MRQETITKNTPIHPRKATFFKSMVAFYENAVKGADVMPLNDKQKEIAMAINGFDNNGTRLPYYSLANVSVLDKQVVADLTPTHRRKISLYRALVLFFDATLSAKKDYDEENGGEVDAFITLAVASIPSSIGASIIAVNVANEVADKKKNHTPKVKKHYSVAVHFDVAVCIEVDAEDEDDAIEQARELAWDADTDNDADWNITDVDIIDED